MDSPPNRASRVERSAPTRPHVPRLVLDEEGTIRDLNGAARGVLEYSPDAFIEPCFFSHVHRRNLRRVMLDLAHMIRRGKERAHWLLRLRTGTERWRWYRAEVENLRHASGQRVQVLLDPL